MIDKFDGKYEYLSNFHVLENPINHIHHIYPTSEHMYQALKTIDMEKRSWIASDPSPAVSKRRGRQVPLRPDWDKVKNEIMRFCLTFKFAYNPKLMVDFVNTYPNPLIEGNTWHDNYWGNCVCPKCSNIPGQNWLGISLMWLRQHFLRVI